MKTDVYMIINNIDTNIEPNQQYQINANCSKLTLHLFL